MENRQIRANARQNLGGQIFEERWLMALVVCLVYSLLVSFTAPIALITAGPLAYGVSKIFLYDVCSGKKASFDSMFDGFTKAFGDSFIISLLTGIFVALWSLLFVIPGIVKSFSYRMAYYIKMDHPELDGLNCITASKNLMKGHKWQLFCLDFSFLGWYIVGALCLGIGTLWVVPYHQAAEAEFYRSIASEAVLS